MKGYVLFFLLLFSINAKAQTITGYQYWFDGNINTGQLVNGSFSADATIDPQLQTINLTAGLHSISFMAKQSDGKWSSIISQTFYNINGNGVAGYEYWFDTAFSTKKTVLKPVNNNLVITAEELNATALKNGFHQLNIRLKPDGGLWSNVQSELFFKRANDIQPLSRLVKVRYWFNTDFDHARYITLGDLINNSIKQTLENEEDLPPGNNTLYYQFKDNGGLWSAINADDFIKNPNEYTLKVFPKITIDKANYASGQNILINGFQFVQNSKIILYIKNSNGELVAAVKDISIDEDGELNYSYPLPANWKKDIYYIQASDQSSFHLSNVSCLSLNASLNNAITITYPNLQCNGTVNASFFIKWSQYIDAISAFQQPLSNYFEKSYKLEYSLDNGITWIFIKNYVNKSSVVNKDNYMQELFVPNAAGNYLFKITELGNNPGFAISLPINIDNASPEGVYTTFHWDKSAPLPYSNTITPTGLAADSTARFLVKLNKKTGNNLAISSITASIEPIGYSIPATSTRILGRISFATNPTSYTLEADNSVSPSFANSTSVTYPQDQSMIPDPDNLYFWYCAPIDYALSPTDYSGIRKVKIKFDVHYQNSSVVETSYTNEIEIVRPPLLFVHGLNSDNTAFSNAKFNLTGTGEKKFSDAALKIWPIVTFADLDPAGSYEKNANILMGTYCINNNCNDDKIYHGSFIEILKAMREKGYACNRVDYIGHSMGGCVARMASQLMQFRPLGQTATNSRYMNYMQGYINKLITVNTPHNGSPIADLVVDYVNQANKISVADLFTWNGKAKIAYRALIAVGEGITNGDMPNRLPYIPGILVLDHGESKYTTSDAIRNLRFKDSKGKKLQETFLKNHLISGDLTKTTLLKELTDCIESNPNDPKIANDCPVLNKIISWGREIKIIKDDPRFRSFTKDLSTLQKQVLFVNFILEKLGLFDFLINSDGVVPLTSQSPDNMNLTPVDITDDYSVAGKRSVLYGFYANHLCVTNMVEVGNRAFYLLNTPLNDANYFANSIPENNGSTNSETIESLLATSADSVFYRFESEKIKIITPINGDTTNMDSVLFLTVKIFDTTDLKDIQVYYQGNTYSSFSKDAIQVFKIKNKPIDIGRVDLAVFANYDSTGFLVKHLDGVIINVASDAVFESMTTYPKTFYISPGQQFKIPVTISNTAAMATVGYSNDLLSHVIVDTNVVIYDTTSQRFIAKAIGNTQVIFQYQNLKDTAYVYIADVETNVTLPVSFVNFNGDKVACNTVNLNWKTNQEINNKEFVVEQSINGNTFKTIATISAKGNAGGEQNYQYKTEYLSNGNYYYRLKQIDNGGAFTYSSTISIKVNCNKNDIHVSPNPATAQITIVALDVSVKHTIRILDSKGAVIKKMPGVSGNVINISDIPNGLYFIKVDEFENLKFIKM